MGSYRQQTLIEAPVEAVWAQVGDPNTYPAWAGETVEVKGLDTIEAGARYEQTQKPPFGSAKPTEFVVDAFEEMHEISVRCTVSGFYLHWLLTEAGEDTFAEVEVGMDPTNVGYRAADVALGKRWYRRTAESTLEQLRRQLA
jgi:polyketide cyclase/dehydrase/lipid transport protein